MNYAHEQSPFARYVFFGVVAFIVLSIGAAVVWNMHQSRVKVVQEQVSAVLLKHMQSFDGLKQKPSASREEWLECARTIDLDAQSLPPAPLKPFVELLRAESLRRAGDISQASEITKRVLPSIRYLPSLYSVYMLSYGQMMLESSDAAVQQQGKDMLVSFAQEKHLELQGVAWYQLHHYAVAHGDDELRTMAEARLRAFPRWQQLANFQVGSQD